MTDLRVVGGELRPPAPERRHLLTMADVGPADVSRILATAGSFARAQERETKKLPTLRGRLVVNLFYESSTRTSSYRLPDISVRRTFAAVTTCSNHWRRT